MARIAALTLTLAALLFADPESAGRPAAPTPRRFRSLCAPPAFTAGRSTGSQGPARPRGSCLPEPERARRRRGRGPARGPRSAGGAAPDSWSRLLRSAATAGTWPRFNSASPGTVSRPDDRRRLRIAHGAAVRRFQAWSGLTADGVAGPATMRRSRHRSAARPSGWSPRSARGIGDRFGPRGNGFHPGIDYPAPTGTPVRPPGAAASFSRAGTPVATATWS